MTNIDGVTGSEVLELQKVISEHFRKVEELRGFRTDTEKDERAAIDKFYVESLEEKRNFEIAVAATTLRKKYEAGIISDKTWNTVYGVLMNEHISELKSRRKIRLAESARKFREAREA